MIQATIRRFDNAPAGVRFAAPIVVGAGEHRALIVEQLAAIGVTASALVLEPIARNTAATALLAALSAKAIDPDALVLLLPADHRIANPGAFLQAIARAAPTARERIVTFGIQPDGPETGYGYIEQGEALSDGVFAIARFHEKPSRTAAQAMLAKGGHYWNAGIFFFNPAVVESEFALAPAIRDTVSAAFAQAKREHGDYHLPHALFALTPQAPFDVAIMEKTSRSAVAPCDIGWADVGSFSELWRLAPHDDAGNAIFGAAVAKNCRNCLIIADAAPLAVSDVQDMVVIATGNGVLMTPMAQAQDVKALVALLKDRGLV